MLNERKTRLNKSNPYPFWLKAPLILIGLCLLVLILSYGRFILMPLAFAAMFSMLLNPVIQWFESWRMGRVVSIILALLIITVLLSGFMTLITVQFIQFSDSLPDIADKLRNTSYDSIHFIEGITGMILFIPLIGILRVGFSQVQVLKPYGYLLGNIIDYKESEQKSE
jgi:putative heme transporter